LLQLSRLTGLSRKCGCFSESLTENHSRESNPKEGQYIIYDVLKINGGRWWCIKHLIDKANVCSIGKNSFFGPWIFPQRGKLNKEGRQQVTAHLQKMNLRFNHFMINKIQRVCQHSSSLRWRPYPLVLSNLWWYSETSRKRVASGLCRKSMVIRPSRHHSFWCTSSKQSYEYHCLSKNTTLQTRHTRARQGVEYVAEDADQHYNFVDLNK